MFTRYNNIYYWRHASLVGLIARYRSRDDDNNDV